MGLVLVLGAQAGLPAALPGQTGSPVAPLPRGRWLVLGSARLRALRPLPARELLHLLLSGAEGPRKQQVRQRKAAQPSSSQRPFSGIFLGGSCPRHTLPFPGWQLKLQPQTYN